VVAAFEELVVLVAVVVVCVAVPGFGGFGGFANASDATSPETKRAARRSALIFIYLTSETFGVDGFRLQVDARSTRFLRCAQVHLQPGPAHSLWAECRGS